MLMTLMIYGLKSDKNSDSEINLLSGHKGLPPFSSPWLHIEVALANGMQMPCLIIYEKNICRDGMFDDTIIQSDKNMFSLPYSDNITLEDKNMLCHWFSLVRGCHIFNCISFSFLFLTRGCITSPYHLRHEQRQPITLNWLFSAKNEVNAA